ncbi:transcriptional regulator [Acrocarpospora phusangensis]|uniref:Transcriptional regulator n=1 Tax=Acrocarpospora phusangensis TaxID=1070424 RepID=A0A919QBD7_9ACTN|nr:PLP-dependent aminotransferase family protein [Acrocarpospora phusangensis]GIH24268.1 transcriptional regulator [Acrocarpospora phusangensis]
MNEDSSIAKVADILREEAHRLGPGAKLRSSRELVRELGVSPVTVSRAIARLTAEGRVITRPGSGAFAAPGRRASSEASDSSWQTVALGDRVVDDTGVAGLLAEPGEGVIPLTGGYLNANLRPARELSAAAARAVRRPDAWALPPLSGLPELRRWFAGEVGVSRNDVLVVSGGQAALSHAFRALAAPGEPVLVETPTYPGALATAKLAGLRAVAVPVDRDGVRPELLAEAFAVTGARVFYCQPTLHNPTGATLTPERREQVLAVARAAGAFIIEDDFSRYLATSTPPPALVSMDDHGTVVHVLSLSKISAPSLRVAGLIARGPAARRLRASQVVESFFVARPLQETAVEFVTSPAWRRHLLAARREIGERQRLLLTLLARHLPAAEVHLVPPGGLHLWVRLPDETDEPALVERAHRAGALVSPGAIYYPAEPPGPRIRLTHTAPADHAELTEGVVRLASAFERG